MKARILVVEDEPMVAEVVERYLRRDGYTVSVVHDGDKAMDAFEREVMIGVGIAQVHWTQREVGGHQPRRRQTDHRPQLERRKRTSGPPRAHGGNA